jgi:type IV pilus assembly protein PilC
MAGLLRSGLTLHTSLSLLHSQSNKWDKKTLGSLLEGIEEGTPLSVLLRKHHFHPMVPAMVMVGEASGNLSASFSRLGDYYAHRHEWRQKVTSALLYPCIVAGVMILVSLFVLYGILPRFENLYLNLGFSLPEQTRRLFVLTSRVRNVLPWIFLILSLLPLLPFLLRRMILSRFPAAAEILFFLPGIRTVWRMWISFRLADSLSVMASNGVPLLQILATCESSARLSLERKVVRQIKDRILSGETLTESLRSQFWIDPLLVHSVHAAEASGDLAGICGFASKELENDLQRIVQRLVQLVEPSIIVGLGAMIGFIVLAVVLPMLQMVQSI